MNFKLYNYKQTNKNNINIKNCLNIKHYKHLYKKIKKRFLHSHKLYFKKIITFLVYEN